MRMALPVLTSTNVAATFPQSRNFSARLPRRHPVTTRDGVGGAAVDLDEGDEALAVFSVRIVDAEFLQAEHGEAHAQDLAGTEVSVGLFGVAKIFVEGFHGKAFSYQLSAFSLTLCSGRLPRLKAPSNFLELRRG